MSAARRVLLAAVAPSVLWVLIVIFKAIWHPSWGDALSDWGAGTSCVLIAVAWVSYPRGVPLLSERRTKKQLTTLRGDVDTLKQQMGAQLALRESGLEGMRRALEAADIPVPDCVAADAPTQPVLRAIGKRAV